MLKIGNRLHNFRSAHLQGFRQGLIESVRSKTLEEQLSCSLKNSVQFLPSGSVEFVICKHLHAVSVAAKVGLMESLAKNILMADLLASGLKLHIFFEIHVPSLQILFFLQGWAEVVVTVKLFWCHSCISHKQWCGIWLTPLLRVYLIRDSSTALETAHFYFCLGGTSPERAMVLSGNHIQWVSVGQKGDFCIPHLMF